MSGEFCLKYSVRNYESDFMQALKPVSYTHLDVYKRQAVVAVDEAVALAKKYSTEKSVGFVNGVLAGFLAEEVQK